MEKETYNVLIAQMSATIYAGFLAYPIKTKEQEYAKLSPFVDAAKQLARLAGVQEPKE